MAKEAGTKTAQQFVIKHNLLGTAGFDFPPIGSTITRDRLNQMVSGGLPMDINRLIEIGALEPVNGAVNSTATEASASAASQASTSTETAGDGLDELKKDELIAAAEEEGVEVTDSMKKQEIIEAIRAKRSGTAQGNEGDGEVAE